MSSYPHPIIAREGWAFVAAAFAVAIGITLFAGFAWSLFFWMIALFVLQFFRDPPREVPADPRAVLAPADGRVVAVERAHDPYLNRDALKFSVFMNVFNVHSNRSPVDGEVREVWYHRGGFVNAALPKASLENERNALWIRTAAGTDVACVQIAGLIARRIVCDKKVGDTVQRGERIGLIKFGSRVDLLFGPEWKLAVNVGDRVSAGESVLAKKK